MKEQVHGDYKVRVDQQDRVLCHSKHHEVTIIYFIFSICLFNHPSLVESPSIEKEVMASNVIGIIVNLFISILFKYKTCSRKNFHQIMIIDR